MHEADIDSLLSAVEELNNASIKLLILVGPPSSGKTRLIRQLAETLEWPLLNLGQQASGRFLDLTARQRKLRAGEVIEGVLEAVQKTRVFADNTEILFDRNLALDPVRALTSFARNRILIATWNGHFESGSLIYAYPEHPEYFKGPANGFPVVTVADNQFNLCLQP